MSWESYSQRASGSNVDRVLAEMSDTQRRREEQRRVEEQMRARQQFEMEQARRDAEARVTAAYMTNPNRQTYAAAQQFGVNLGEFQETPEQAYQRMVAEGSVRAAQNDPVFYGMAPGGVEAYRYNTLTGDNPNEAVAQAGVRTATYANQQLLPAPVVSAQRVNDKLDMNAEEREKSRQYWKEFESIKLPESQVGVTKSRAETGKIGAETRKIGEETTTERESRDPNSPTAKAKGSAAGRKTFSEKMADSLDREIADLRKDASALEMKMMETGRGATIDKKLGATRLESLRATIAAKTTQRDALMSGRGEAYSPQKRSTPKQFSAEDERGIAAVMAAKGYTRAQAIAAIREAAKKKAK